MDGVNAYVPALDAIYRPYGFTLIKRVRGVVSDGLASELKYLKPVCTSSFSGTFRAYSLVLVEHVHRALLATASSIGDKLDRPSYVRADRPNSIGPFDLGRSATP